MKHLLTMTCCSAGMLLFNPATAQTNTEYAVFLNRELSSAYSDYAPRFMDNTCRSLIFTSKRGTSLGSADERFFYATIGDKVWNTPQPVTSGDYSHNYGVFSTDNKRHIAFFTKCSPVNCGLFYTFMQGDMIGESFRVKLPLDSGTIEMPSLRFGHPCYSEELGVLFFSCNLPGGYGKLDIWFSKYDAATDTWSKPQNAGPQINTAADDLYPFLTPDGTLYFTTAGRDGYGKWDIFKAAKQDGLSWGNAINMGNNINSPEDDFGIVFKGAEQYGYFSSNRKGGMGDNDIYAFSVIEKIEKKTVNIAVPAETKISETNVASTVKTTENKAATDNAKTIEAFKTILSQEVCNTNVNGLRLFDPKVYPNPSRGSFTIEFKTNKRVPIIIRLHSSTGQQLLLETVIAQEGGFSKPYTFDNLAPGIYYVQLMYNCETIHTEQLLIQP